MRKEALVRLDGLLEGAADDIGSGILVFAAVLVCSVIANRRVLMRLGELMEVERERE